MTKEKSSGKKEKYYEKGKSEMTMTEIMNRYRLPKKQADEITAAFLRMTLEEYLEWEADIEKNAPGN